MKKIKATEANFIKLGRGGEWETECLRDGTIRFGYHSTPHDLCISGDWAAVFEHWRGQRGDSGAATRDKNQIRTFYEAGENSVFITFSNGFMYWCQPKGSVEVLSDGGRKRRTVDGWHKTTVSGTPLTLDRLSGNLLKVQMFRGTICQIKPFQYLIRKLKDEQSPEVVASEKAEHAMQVANVALMRLLTWQDFELLVDLVFSSSGWRRVGVVGQTQKTVDLDLVLPTTGERAFVQVKSHATEASLREYSKRFEGDTAYDRMFFVWHSGVLTESDEKAETAINLIGPDRLAEMVIQAGLSSWLREKVS